MEPLHVRLRQLAQHDDDARELVDYLERTAREIVLYRGQTSGGSLLLVSRRTNLTLRKVGLTQNEATDPAMLGRAIRALIGARRFRG